MLAARLTAQLLSGPPGRSPEDVVRRLLAVQAQDPRGARLAVRSRSVGLGAADVDEALTTRRSLVVSWLNRGTLHLVTPDDYRLLHPLTTPQLVTGNVRRLSQEGVSERQADRGVEVVAAAVAEGPQTRGELKRRLDEAGVPTAGQALVHLLVAATLRGHVVRGPMVGGDQAFVEVTGWLGAPPERVEREELLARLARRYLAGHGPADDRDLARWAGIPLRDARVALAAIDGEVTRQDGGLVDLGGREPPAELPGPRLLGAFDPLLLGWVSRDAVVGRHRGVVTSNGLFRPFALVDGRAVATWGLAGGVVTLRPMERVGRSALSALRADARDVLRFLGAADPRARVEVVPA